MTYIIEFKHKNIQINKTDLLSSLGLLISYLSNPIFRQKFCAFRRVEKQV